MLEVEAAALALAVAADGFGVDGLADEAGVGREAIREFGAAFDASAADDRGGVAERIVGAAPVDAGLEVVSGAAQLEALGVAGADEGGVAAGDFAEEKGARAE